MSAARAMKGESVELEAICAGNWHFRKSPVLGARKIVEGFECTCT